MTYGTLGDDIPSNRSRTAKDVVHTLAAGSWVFAVLLAMAGVAKLLSPDATDAALQGARLPSSAMLVRLLGAGEIALAVAVLAVGGAVFAALLCGAYLAFGAFAWRQSRKGEGCGCFGEPAAPATALHVGIDVLGALLGGAAVVWPIRSPVQETGDWATAALIAALVLLGAMLLRLALTALPALAVATDRVMQQ